MVPYRSSSPFGAAIQPDYLINGKAVAGSQPNGFVVCDLKPGRHEIGVANSSLNISLFNGKDKYLLELKAGTTTFVQAQPQIGATIYIITLSPVTESEGRSDTAALHKIDGACPAA